MSSANEKSIIRTVIANAEGLGSGVFMGFLMYLAPDAVAKMMTVETDASLVSRNDDGVVRLLTQILGLTLVAFGGTLHICLKSTGILDTPKPKRLLLKVLLLGDAMHLTAAYLARETLGGVKHPTFWGHVGASSTLACVRIYLLLFPSSS